MDKKFTLGLVLALVVLPTFIAPQKAQAQSVSTRYVTTKSIDVRTMILRDYLAKNKSPMTNSASDFIEAAQTHGLDWKLVVSIAGTESTFGKFVPGGTDPKSSSFNGWGWGVYGTQAIYFDSWRDGIFTVSEGLKTKYVDKGLTTPAQMNRVYAASKTWGSKVQYFMDDIEKFAQGYPEYKALISQENLNEISINTQTAATSAKLALAN